MRLPDNNRRSPHQTQSCLIKSKLSACSKIRWIDSRQTLVEKENKKKKKKTKKKEKKNGKQEVQYVQRGRIVENVSEVCTTCRNDKEEGQSTSVPWWIGNPNHQLQKGRFPWPKGQVYTRSSGPWWKTFLKSFQVSFAIIYRSEKTASIIIRLGVPHVIFEREYIIKFCYKTFNF